jgi:hypothetical protein
VKAKKRIRPESCVDAEIVGKEMPKFWPLGRVRVVISLSGTLRLADNQMHKQADNESKIAVYCAISRKDEFEFFYLVCLPRNDALLGNFTSSRTRCFRR